MTRSLSAGQAVGQQPVLVVRRRPTLTAEERRVTPPRVFGQATVAVLSPRAGPDQGLLHLLQRQGYDVLSALSMQELLELVTVVVPDLIVLHRAGDGAPDPAALAHLREVHPPAVIVIVGEPADDREVIACLDSGACDYVIAAPSPRVLLARIRAHLRRRARDCPSSPPPRPVVPTLDPADGSLTVGHQRLRLRGRQFQVLAYLVAHQDRVVPSEELMAQLWPADHPPSAGALKSLLCALRARLRTVAPDGGSIVTLRRHGYRYDPPRVVDRQRWSRPPEPPRPTPGPSG